MQDRFDVSFHLRHVADFDVTHRTIVDNRGVSLASIDLFFVVILVFNLFVRTRNLQIDFLSFSYENHRKSYLKLFFSVFCKK